MGLILRSDMRWVSNTENMVNRASFRLWLLRRLKFLGAGSKDLVEIENKQIHSILELAAPAWQGGISQAEKQDLERVQKSATGIILGPSYTSYRNALEGLQLDSLENRRNKISLKFALKSEKHDKFNSGFKPATKTVNTRTKVSKNCHVKSIHARFSNSLISFLTRLLNLYYKQL